MKIEENQRKSKKNNENLQKINESHGKNQWKSGGFYDSYKDASFENLGKMRVFLFLVDSFKENSLALSGIT